MFLDKSRYARLDVVEVNTADGKTVEAIKLRRLPPTKGSPTVVSDQDRLDVLAQRRYGEPTWFWHIADANSELEANELTARPQRAINIPET